MKTVFSLLVAVGCSAIDNAKDAVEGATETTVMQSSVLAVQDPQNSTISAMIQLTPFAPGTSDTIFLADASSPDDLEDSPITGATADLEGAPLDEIADGTYALDPISGPPYEVGATWTTTVDIGDGTARTANVELPPPDAAAVWTTTPTTGATTLGLAVDHRLGEPLTVNLDPTYASSVVVLIDPNGEVAYSNNPESITDLYEAMKSDTALPVEIPGDAFSVTGIYAVGVAGMYHTTADDLDGFNTVISKLRAGQMVWTPLEVQ